MKYYAVAAHCDEKERLSGKDGGAIAEYSEIFGEMYKGQKFLLEGKRAPCGQRIYRIGRILDRREGGETVIYDIEALPEDEQRWIFTIITAVSI